MCWHCTCKTLYATVCHILSVPVTLRACSEVIRRPGPLHAATTDRRRPSCSCALWEIKVDRAMERSPLSEGSAADNRRCNSSLLRAKNPTELRSKQFTSPFGCWTSLDKQPSKVQLLRYPSKAIQRATAQRTLKISQREDEGSARCELLSRPAQTISDVQRKPSVTWLLKIAPLSPPAHSPFCLKSGTSRWHNLALTEARTLRSFKTSGTIHV